MTYLSLNTSSRSEPETASSSYESLVSGAGKILTTSSFMLLTNVRQRPEEETSRGRQEDHPKTLTLFFVWNICMVLGEIFLVCYKLFFG